MWVMNLGVSKHLSIFICEKMDDIGHFTHTLEKHKFWIVLALIIEPIITCNELDVMDATDWTTSQQYNTLFHDTSNILKKKTMELLNDSKTKRVDVQVEVHILNLCTFYMTPLCTKGRKLKSCSR